MKIFKPLFVLFMVLSLSSCLKNDSDSTCYEISGTPTTAVQGPTATTVGVPINLDVTYTVLNTCDSFLLFFEEIDQSVKYLTVNVRYDGCNCEEEVTDRIKQYEFISFIRSRYICFTL